jgi:hypothetical protein
VWKWVVFPIAGGPTKRTSSCSGASEVGASETGGTVTIFKSTAGTTIDSREEGGGIVVEGSDARARDARGSEITAEGVTGAGPEMGLNVELDAVVFGTSSEEGWKPVSVYGAGRRPRKYSCKRLN